MSVQNGTPHRTITFAYGVVSPVRTTNRARPMRCLSSSWGTLWAPGNRAELGAEGLRHIRQDLHDEGRRELEVLHVVHAVHLRRCQFRTAPRTARSRSRTGSSPQCVPRTAPGPCAA